MKERNSISRRWQHLEIFYYSTKYLQALFIVVANIIFLGSCVRFEKGLCFVVYIPQTVKIKKNFFGCEGIFYRLPRCTTACVGFLQSLMVYLTLGIPAKALCSPAAAGHRTIEAIRPLLEEWVGRRHAALPSASCR
jgi:hypothetical protein